MILKKVKILLLSLFLINLFVESNEIIKIDCEEAIFFAIKNNYELKIAKATVLIKSKGFYYELRKFLPNFSFGYNQNNSISFDAGDSHSQNLSMGVDFLVFDGGKLILNSLINKIEVDLIKKEIQYRVAKITYDIKNKYNSLLILHEKEKIQEELLKIATIQEKNSELELKTGSISEIDYYDIKLKTKQIEIELEKIKRERNNQLIEFKHLLGLDNLEIELVAVEKYNFLNLSIEDIRTLQGIALSKRLDIKQSYHSILKNKVQYWYTIFSFLPEIKSGFNFSLTDEEFPPRNKSCSFNIEIKIPIAYFPARYSPQLGVSGDVAKRNIGDNTQMQAVENLTYENDILKSIIDLASSDIKNKELIRNIKNEVKVTVENYIETLKIYNLKLLQNDFGKKKLSILRLKFELGEITRVELLEEEMKYNQSKIEEKSILFELINLESKLQEILGVGTLNINELLLQLKNE